MAWWNFWRRTPKHEHEHDPEDERETRRVKLEARNIIHRNVYLAMGAGVMPFPLIDMAVLTGIQLKMIAQLAKLHHFPFRKKLARTALISLLTGAGGIGVGGLIAASLFKSVPVVGHALGGVTAPVFSGMLTYAVGRTFATHFGLGGTLLDFDPKVMRDHFEKEFRRAQEVVPKMGLEPPPDDPPVDPPADPPAPS